MTGTTRPDLVTVEVTATAMATDGRAVARLGSGKVLFVSAALPGETVLAAVDDERSSHASGHVVEVVESSPDRVEPACPQVAAGCGGCQWQHIAPEAQVRLKEDLIRETVRRFGRIEAVTGLVRPSVQLPPWRYRTGIRVGVGGDGRAGFRRLGSHDLVDAAACLVAHPLLADLLDGDRYRGAREVILRCGARTGERLAVATPRRVALDVPPDVQRRYFHEEAAGRRWRISAASFFQSRPDGADALAALVAEAAGSPRTLGARALDLYSGVGLFAGVLTGRKWSVTAVEGDPSSVRDARANLAGDAAEVVQADVTRWSPPIADLVVADPSRAGLGRAGTAVVAASEARRVVLVSCDVASLGRDVGLLAGAGYRLVSVTPVNLFPQTFRIEAVSVLDRV